MAKVRTLLINPPFNRLKGLKSAYFPLGLGCLAANLAKNGFEARIYNAENPIEKLSDASSIKLLQHHYRYAQAIDNDGHYVWKEVSDILSEFNPGVVGISVMTAKYRSAVKLSALCKKFNPDLKVIWGGPDPTIRSTEVLQNRDVDFVVRGEGDLAIVELCTALSSGTLNFNDIDGLSFKADDRIIHNKFRKLISNLDEIPPPAKDLILYPERYPRENMGDMVTSRGCPFECAFCGAQNIWGRKVRYRSTEMIVDELTDISRKYGIREFWFWDDSFTVNRERIIELCQKIIDNNLNISWGCTSRVDLVDDMLVSKMKRAGCYMMEFGIESGSEKVLKQIKKNITLDQIRRAATLMEKHKIEWKAFLMIGFPEETKEDIRKTERLIREINPSGIVLSIFTPYPGSELYDRAIALGLIQHKPTEGDFSHQSPENHFIKYINKDDFQEIVNRQMKLVDQYNYSLAKAMSRLRARFFFFLAHPYILLKKTLTYVKQKFVWEESV